MEPIKKILPQIETQEYESKSNDIEPDYSLETNRLMWLKTSGIPLRYQSKTFDDFKVTKGNNKAFNTCKDYADQFPLRIPVDYLSLGLFSNGTWGVGKTHLVCAIAKCLINKCQRICPVLYLTEPEMLMRFRNTYNHRDGDDTESEVLVKLSNVPLLIIDDVGKEEVADPRFVQRIWFSIINARYDNLLPVIITANLDPDGIAYHLGGNRSNEATFDRLIEMLNGVFYEITGSSYRREQWNVR